MTLFAETTSTDVGLWILCGLAAIIFIGNVSKAVKDITEWFKQKPIEEAHATIKDLSTLESHLTSEIKSSREETSKQLVTYKVDSDKRNAGIHARIEKLKDKHEADVKRLREGHWQLQGKVDSLQRITPDQLKAELKDQDARFDQKLEPINKELIESSQRQGRMLVAIARIEENLPKKRTEGK